MPGAQLQGRSQLLGDKGITPLTDERRIQEQRSFQKIRPVDSRVGTRKVPARLAPEKISVARLPVTGSDVFGREEDIAFPDRAWAKQDVNVVTIVAWAFGYPSSRS
jgi:hypothetical protein